MSSANKINVSSLDGFRSSLHKLGITKVPGRIPGKHRMLYCIRKMNVRLLKKIVYDHLNMIQTTVENFLVFHSVPACLEEYHGLRYQSLFRDQ